MGNELIHIGNTASVEETKRLASALAKCLQAGDVVLLNGSLGAGKTHFVQGVAEALGISAPVTSPTFNILQTYTGGSLVVNHFDLYRLESEIELDDIGYWEVLEDGGVALIEWGDKFPDQQPDDFFEIVITIGIDEVRSIKAQAHGARAEALHACWAQGVGELA